MHPSSVNARGAGIGLASKGFDIGLIYAIAFVVVVAMRGTTLDSFALAVPAIGLAAIGGGILRRFERPGLLPVLALVAVIAGVTSGALT